MRWTLCIAAPAAATAFSALPAHHLHFSSHGFERSVNAVVLPGFGVAPERYTPVAEALCADLGSRNISANVFIAKYTCDILSHLQAESRVKEIVQHNDNVLLVGHSQGAYLAEFIAQKLQLPLVQWAGGSYGGKVADLNASVLTILCEQDKSHPCLRALTSGIDAHTQRLSDPSKLMTTVPDADHFHGVLKKDVSTSGVEDIAHRISAFAAYTFYKDDLAMQQLSQHVEETDARFTPFIQEQRTASIGAWCTRRQDDVSPSPPRYAVVHSPESHFLTTIFSIAYPWIGVPLDACYFFPKFVFSHPTEESIHVHKAWRKFGMWGSLMFRSLDETEASVKLRYDGQKCPSAQLLNQRTFAEAFDLLPSEQQDAYLRDGKRLVFGADIHIPHIPLCSLLWLATPLQYRNVDANTVAISSPVLKTMPGTGKYEGRLNAKLLTIPQALEWLLIKAFM